MCLWGQITPLRLHRDGSGAEEILDWVKNRDKAAEANRTRGAAQHRAKNSGELVVALL